MQAHGLERLGAKGELVPEIPGAVAGKERLGAATMRAEPGAEALYKISRKALWNTQPHEQLHILLNDVLRHGTPTEQNLVKRMLREHGWDGRSDPLAFEEALVQRSGEKFVDLMLNPKSRSLRADFASWLDQFSKRTLPRRYERMLAEWLQQGRTPWDDQVMARISGKPIERDEKAKAQDISKFQDAKLPNNERIHSTAILFDGKPIVGANKNDPHYSIIEQHINKLGHEFNSPEADKLIWDKYFRDDGSQDGFITNTGRFLTRDQASELIGLAKSMESLDSAHLDKNAELYKKVKEQSEFAKAKENQNALQELRTSGVHEAQTPEAVQGVAPEVRSTEGIGTSESTARGAEETKYQDVTKSPEFKRWFGNSIAVNNNTGEPLRLFHGTRTEDPINIVDPTTKNITGKPREAGPLGFWVTPSKNYAYNYASNWDTKNPQFGPVYEVFGRVNKIHGYGGRFILDDGTKVQLPVSDTKLTREQFIDYVHRFGRYPDDGFSIKNGAYIKGNNKADPGFVYDNWAHKDGPSLYDFFKYTDTGLITKSTISNYNDRALLRDILLENGYDAHFNSGNGRGELALLQGESQIKSATGNRGTFDPNNPDIRYQDVLTKIADDAALRPRGSRNPFAGVVARLRATGHHATADTINRVDAVERGMIGRYYNPVIKALDALSSAEQAKVRSVLIKELRDNTSHKVELIDRAQQQAYDAIRSTLKTMAEDQRLAGQKLETGKVRGVDPYYMPQIVSQRVRTILREKKGTPEFEKLQSEFINHQTKNGKTETEAVQNFRNWLGRFSETKLASSEMEYDPVSMPEGIGVPDSWLETDLKSAMARYIRAFSRARARWQVMDTDPRFRASVNETEYYVPHEGLRPIPPQIMAVEGLPSRQVADQEPFRQFMEYLGGAHQQSGRTLQSLGAFVNSLLLGGPLTKITDIATTPLKMVALVPPQHQGAILRGIADWRKGLEDSFRTGLNRAGGRLVLQDVLGATEELNSSLMKAANAITKYTGSEKLEQLGRGLAQSIGNYVGDTQRALAKQGDAKAQMFLNKLGTDWATVSREELGARIAQIAQGKYDITNLPPWIYNSPVAPFLTMMKWSVEQLNNFNTYALNPIKENGDWWPLIATLVSGIGGGLALEQLRAELGNRKQNTATLAELKHAEGRPGYLKELMYKAIAAAQISGTAGIAGEFARQAYEVANGQLPQGFRYPLASVAQDIGGRVLSAGKALKDGEEVFSVLPQLLADVGTTHVQALRFLVNQSARFAPQDFELAGVNPVERMQQMNQSRDRRVYDRLSGLPSEVGPRTFPEYRTLTERRFDRSKDLGEAALMAESLTKRALSNPQLDVVRSRLRSAATIPNRQMPSLERNPLRWMDYRSWVEKTQGPEAANRLVNSYLQTEALRKAKSSMIPQLH